MDGQAWIFPTIEKHVSLPADFAWAIGGNLSHDSQWRVFVAKARYATSERESNRLVIEAAKFALLINYQLSGPEADSLFGNATPAVIESVTNAILTVPFERALADLTRLKELADQAIAHSPRRSAASAAAGVPG